MCHTSYTERRCETCGHFFRHYTRTKTGGYCATAYGHCPYPGMKVRKLEDTRQMWTPAAREAGKTSAPE